MDNLLFMRYLKVFFFFSLSLSLFVCIYFLRIETKQKRIAALLFEGSKKRKKDNCLITDLAASSKKTKKKTKVISK